MFMLEVKKFSKVVALALFAAGTLYAGNVVDVKGPSFKDRAIDGGIEYKVKNGAYDGVYKVNTQVSKTKAFGYGRAATPNEIKASDIDVRYDFQGLPDGHGTVAEGDALYAKNCQMCHGEFGAGGKGYPTLAGGEGTLKNQLIDPENGDEPPVRTIGSYWPYASTIWWYVKTGMPFPHPMSLTNDQVYAIVAYLLSINDIQIDGQDLDDDYVLNKEKFMKVVMPNADGFYPKVHGKSGAQNVKKFLSDGKNYGTPSKRCMKNCPTGKVVHIKHTLNEGIKPPVNEKRDLPKEPEGKAKGNSKFAKLFESKCKTCHGNAAIAPLVGNKEAWAPRIKEGKETLYKHAIKGFKGMPPKGGSADLSDGDVKGIVDYIVEQSQ